MIAPDHSRPALLEHLVDRGLQIELGPFLIHVRSELNAVRGHIEQLYADFPIHDGIDGHFDIAIVGGRGVRRWVRPQAAIVINGSRPFLPLPATLAGPLLEWGLNWCIERSAHRWVVVHAAVVARKGQAIILPAPPGSGKSTLCAALAFSGWQLFSDELALIDPDTGRVWPIPRPLSLKEGSIEIIRRRYPDVVYGPEGHDVEGERFVHARPPADSVRRAGESARPAWIVSPRYVPGAGTTFEPVLKAQALMNLADQSFNYNYLGPEGYQCLAKLVGQADTYNLEYSDLDDVLAQLGRLTPP